MACAACQQKYQRALVQSTGPKPQAAITPPQFRRYIGIRPQAPKPAEENTPQPTEKKE